jgi:hypothetical protein
MGWSGDRVCMKSSSQSIKVIYPSIMPGKIVRVVRRQFCSGPVQE